MHLYDSRGCAGYVRSIVCRTVLTYHVTRLVRHQRLFFVPSVIPSPPNVNSQNNMQRLTETPDVCGTNTQMHIKSNVSCLFFKCFPRSRSGSLCCEKLFLHLPAWWCRWQIVIFTLTVSWNLAVKIWNMQQFDWNLEPSDCSSCFTLACRCSLFCCCFLSDVCQIRYISQTQGLPAEYLLSAGTKTSRFFNRGPDSSYPLWRLKVSDSMEKTHILCAAAALRPRVLVLSADAHGARGRDGHQVEGGQEIHLQLSGWYDAGDEGAAGAVCFKFSSGTLHRIVDVTTFHPPQLDKHWLPVLLQVNMTNLEGTDILAEKADRREFIDLLKKMLTLDADKRITPMKTLNHPFVTMTHLLHFPHSSQ